MKHIYLLCLCIAIAGCSREGDETLPETNKAAEATAPSAAASSALPASAKTESTTAVETSAKAVTVGSALQGEHAVRAPKAVFGTGETIYASALPSGKRPGTQAQVYWTYQDGTTHKEETKPLGSTGVWFAFSAADGMKPGRYNVEIDYDMMPVGIADFEIK